MASKKRPSLPKNYKPTEKENFMSARQREYFRRKLLSWREELLDESVVKHAGRELSRARYGRSSVA